MIARFAAAALLEDDVEDRAESDPPYKPERPPSDDFDPRAELDRLVSIDQFLFGYGFDFKEEKEGYRLFIANLPLAEPIPMTTSSNIRYPILRVFARLWENGPVKVRLFLKLIRKIGTAERTWNGKAWKFYYVSLVDTAPKVITQIDSDLRNAQLVAGLSHSANNFFRNVGDRLDFRIGRSK